MTTSASPPSLTARTPEDLLALVPLVLGFVPRDSVVMLTFEGRHTFHARIDLPSGGDGLGQMVDALLEPALRHGVGAVALVLHSRQAPAAERAWRALQRGCIRRGITVIEGLRADGARWFPLRGGPGSPGVPYDLTAHPFVSQAVFEGRVTLRSREDLAAGLARRSDAAARVRAELDALPDVSDDAVCEDPDWIDDAVRRGLDCGPVAPLPDIDVARLVRALADVDLRDDVLTGLSRDNATTHVALWTEVLARTPDQYVPAVATLLGLAAWLAGDGATAWCAVDRCAEVDPDYPLMGLLATALTRAVPPSVWSQFH